MTGISPSIQAQSVLVVPKSSPTTPLHASAPRFVRPVRHRAKWPGRLPLWSLQAGRLLHRWKSPRNDRVRTASANGSSTGSGFSEKRMNGITGSDFGCTRVHRPRAACSLRVAVRAPDSSGFCRASDARPSLSYTRLSVERRVRSCDSSAILESASAIRSFSDWQSVFDNGNIAVGARVEFNDQRTDFAPDLGYFVTGSQCRADLRPGPDDQNDRDDNLNCQCHQYCAHGLSRNINMATQRRIADCLRFRLLWSITIALLFRSGSPC